MNYYILEFQKSHFSNEFFFDLKFVPFKGSDSIAPLFAVSYELDLSKVNFIFEAVFEDVIERNYLSNNKSWVILSKKLLDEINKFPNTCTSYPISIKIGDELHQDAFFLVVPPILSDTLNHEESIFQPHPLRKNKIYNVEKLMLKAIDKHEPIFRIKEYPTPLFISKKLKITLNLELLNGLSIISTENYHW